jgi:hypothetical protein
MSKRKSKSRRKSKANRPADKPPEADPLDDLIDDLRTLAKAAIARGHSRSGVAALKQLAELLALKSPAAGLATNVNATIELDEVRSHLIATGLVDDHDDLPTTEMARLLSLKLLQTYHPQHRKVEL